MQWKYLNLKIYKSNIWYSRNSNLLAHKPLITNKFKVKKNYKYQND